MLIEQTLLGEIDKVQNAIDLLKTYELIAIKNNPNGYYVSYSGGKDSLVIAYLCYLADVKFELHNNHTGIDKPALTYHIRDMKKWWNDKGINLYIHYPKESFFELMPKKLMPPTRRVRYCCEVLKEHGGEGRIVITGVRHAESTKRANNRKTLEANAYTKNKIMLMNDNEEIRRQFESCVKKGKHIINPIITWTDEDVWEFIKKYNLPYCELYDQGWDRLGCIGCPLNKNAGKELDDEPKFKENYKKAIYRMLENRKKKGKDFWNTPNEETVEEVYNWWIYGIQPKAKPIDGQIEMEIEELYEIID